MVQLHIFHTGTFRNIASAHISTYNLLVFTGITINGKAKLICGLKNLKNLVRGDFVCDALDHIASKCDQDGQDMPEELQNSSS